jgi:ribosomal-protein-alanine acetyltransferase
MIVRAAREEDATAVAGLEAELFGADARSLSSVVSELAGGRRCALVAFEDEEVVGFLITAEADGVVDLERVGVRRERQGRGVARALLDRCLEVARESGSARMLLEVSEANAAALRLYEGAGFAEIARRRRYYRDQTDALVLERVIGAPGPGPEEESE